MLNSHDQTCDSWLLNKLLLNPPRKYFRQHLRLIAIPSTSTRIYIMTQPAPASIAIVGAGPCGLTLARLLEQHGGIDYVVYDRDESSTSSTTGGCLDLHPSTGQRALQEAGLFDEFKRFARYEDTLFTIFDTQGSQQLRVGEGRDAPEIDRLQLRRILLDSVPADKIRWGHSLASAELDGQGKPVLTFADGSKVSGFKLVVGTDGAWSKVRQLIMPDKPLYTGKSYIETRIRTDNPLYASATEFMGRGTTSTIGNNHIILSQKQGDASYRLYLGFDAPEHAFHSGGAYDTSTTNLSGGEPTAVEATRARLLSDEHYGTWEDRYKKLIQHATDFRSWCLYSLPPTALSSWVSVPGVTLAGDAAHVAPPNGEGVNLAMTDSLDLARRIIKWSELPSAEQSQEALDRAVQEYEEVMLPRGIETLGQGSMMMDPMFAEDHRPFVDMLNSFVAQAIAKHGANGVDKPDTKE
ncbi:salicylate hydroxylase [Microdochium nivale]|nr:salicylate hydroxylase [Microdochium nivale]